MKTEIVQSGEHPKLEIEVPHYDNHKLTDRLLHGGIWWTMTNCDSRGSFLVATYRVSAYQIGGVK